MKPKNGTTPKMTVAKLFGRCLAIHVALPTGQQASFEVKVMGDRATAALAREQLLVALEMSGFEVAAPASAPGAGAGDE